MEGQQRNDHDDCERLMQITPDQLVAEAGQMALEIRFKDQLIAALQAENARLRAGTAGVPDEQDAPADGHHHHGTAGPAGASAS